MVKFVNWANTYFIFTKFCPLLILNHQISYLKVFGL